MLVLVGGTLNPVQAATVSCGQVLTSNSVLDSDVGPCSNDDVVIGADNITLNLNGRIFGLPCSGDGVGVRIPGRQGVQVHGGRVTDFDAGIAILGGSENVVRQSPPATTRAQ